MIVIQCLKKRRDGIFRAIPVPETLLDTLSKVHALDRADPNVPARLWPWSRMTGYRYIRQVMTEAGLEGPQAMPKGLRHGFGVKAIQAEVPLNLVQRWLGHADMSTTAIYTNAIGNEERSIASKMWKTQDLDRPGSQVGAFAALA